MEHRVFRSRGTDSSPAGLFTTISSSSSYTMSRSPAGPMRGRRFALPGRSIQRRTTSPAASRRGGIGESDLERVDVDLAPLERGYRTCARSGPLAGGEKLVEADARVAARHGPVDVRHVR